MLSGSRGLDKGPSHDEKDLVKELIYVHSSEVTWQWKMDPLKMYFLLKMGIFHCYVSSLEGIHDVCILYET